MKAQMFKVPTAIYAVDGQIISIDTATIPNRGLLLNCVAMDRKQHAAKHELEQATSASAHYAEVTEHMVNFGGDLLACHFGLWGPDATTDQEALLRANRTLVQGCDLGPGQRILDAGCGVGGTAITLAEAYGVHVTGLTICEPHIAVATEHAKQHGVGHLVDFLYGDFMDLPFPDENFT